MKHASSPDMAGRDLSTSERGRVGAALRAGMLAGSPFLIVVFPFGGLFGVVAAEAGLDVVQTMAMTAAVIAGASQFAALDLLGQGAPAFIAVLTGLAVNLRMAMYSASLTPHIGAARPWTKVVAAYFMVDQVYAVSIARYAERPEMGLAEKLAFYFGVVLPVCPFWYLATYLGFELGAAIPDGWGLDFAVAITFCSVVAPLLRGAPNLVAAGVAIVAALGFAWVPWNLGLIVASLLGMAAGAGTEFWLERRANGGAAR